MQSIDFCVCIDIIRLRDVPFLKQENGIFKQENEILNKKTGFWNKKNGILKQAKREFKTRNTKGF